MRTELAFSRMRRRAMLVAAGTLAASVTLVPGSVSAEGLFDMFFGGGQKQQARQAPAQANFFADPFGLNQQPAQAAPRTARGRLRACFLRAQLRRQIFSADHARQCHAGCRCARRSVPASATKVYLRQQHRRRDRRAMASAMRTVKTPSPIARRCAPIAPATAGTRQALRRSISRSTPRCAPAT